MQEKLEKLYEIENMPFIKLVIKHQRLAILIFLAICLHIAVMTSVLQLVNNDKNDNEQAFQSAMAGITVSQDCRGTRYAVYDTAEEKYVLEYLKEEHLAQTAEDVCAVIRIEHKEKQVKQYTEHKYAISADAYGYRRYLVISLIDQKTGETVGVAHVFGEEPPDEVRIETSKLSSEKPKVYGTDPDEDKITEECYSLIEQFESQRNMLDP